MATHTSIWDQGIFYRLAIGRRATNKRQTPTPIPPRLMAHMRRWARRGIVTSHFVEWQGAPIKSVKVGFKHAVKLAGFVGQSHTAHTAAYGGDLADAARRTDLAGCRLSRHVGPKWSSTPTATITLSTCALLRRRSRRNNQRTIRDGARTFHWSFHWSSRKTRPASGKKANEIMVADVVAIEPVSASKFPAIREINREFLRFPEAPRLFFSQNDQQSQSFTGIFPLHQYREFFRSHQGNIFWKQAPS